MCGIAGVLGSDQDPGCVAQMLTAMSHRGPDGKGRYESPHGGVQLGHARLAILDVSTAAGQPMRSDDGCYVLVFNGEVYNFRELRQRLIERGESFRTTSDTEVVLHWLARNGVAGLADLEGMYALALYDTRRREVLLARDPFGIKPLYLARHARGLSFASEVRALLSSGAASRRADPQGLAGYLAYGVVPEPNTIVAGVEMLGPGQWLRWRQSDGAVQQGRALDVLGRPPTGHAEPAEIRAAFLAGVARHLLSDVPIGAFLSGGVDSSAIVAAMAQAPGTDVRTLTVSFPDVPGLDESAHAKAWAAACGAAHHDVPLTSSDLLGDLPGALAAQDQPTYDGLNTYIVARAARAAGLTVALSGVGGDELFGGYSNTQDVPRAARLRRQLGILGPVVGRALHATSRRWSRYASKRVDLLTVRPSLGELYAARRRLFSPRQLAQLWPGGPAPGLPAGLEASDLARLAPEDAVARMEAVFYMRNQLLRDSDVMGMAASLEIRVPFLDTRFAQLAWDAGAAWRDGKRRFAQALSPLLDRRIQERPKRGFTLPLEQWMQGELRASIEACLSALPAPLSSSAALALWRRFLAGPASIGWTRPWALFVLGSYMQRHGIRA